MMKVATWFGLLCLIIALSSGCYRASPIAEDDTDTNMETSAAVDTNTEAEGETDSDSGNDSDSGSDSDTDSDSEIQDVCDDIICSGHGNCIPSGGVAGCVCDSGYAPTGLQCLDIDECALDTHNCGPMGICINTSGGHECMVTPCEPQTLHQLSEAAFDVARVGDYLFVAGGFAGMLIYELDGFGTPTLLSTTPTIGDALKIRVFGNSAYIIGTGLLEIFEVTTPKQPVTQGTHKLKSNYVLDLEVTASRAIVSYHMRGIDIFDISDPLYPQFETTLDGEYGYLNTVIINDILYGVAYSHFFFFQPNAPGQPEVTDVDLSADFQYAPSFRAIAGTDTHLYIVDTSKRFFVYSIESSQTPALIATISIPGIGEHISISGNRAFVSRRDSGMMVVDVSDPAAPTVVSDISDEFGIYAYCSGGSTICPATKNGELLLVDISDPANPVQKTDVARPYRLKNIHVQGQYAFAVAAGSVFVVDISVPLSPTVARRILLDGPIKDSHSVGDTLFITLATEDENLVTFDLSHPLGATPVSTALVLTNPSVIESDGNYLYVLEQDRVNDVYVGNMAVIDIEDLQNPHKIGGVSFDGQWVEKLHINGDYAYVYTWEWQGGQHLNIVNISNKTAPQLIGEFENSSHKLSSVSMTAHPQEELLYIATGAENILAIWDISAPATPTFLSSVEVPGGPVQFIFDGDVAYISTRSSMLYVADLSNPTSPSLTGVYEAVGALTNMAITSDHLFISTLRGGLQVVDRNQSPKSYVLSVFETDASISEICTEGNDLFLGQQLYSQGSTDWMYLLKRFDMTTPASPQETGSYQTEGSIRAISIEQNQIVVGQSVKAANTSPSTGEMTILDGSQPDALSFVGSWSANEKDTIYDIHVDGDYAAVTTMYYTYSSPAYPSHLEIIDIENAAGPVRTDQYELSVDKYNEVEMNDNTVWVLEPNQGLSSFNLLSDGSVELLQTTPFYGGADTLLLDGQRAFVSDDTHFIYVLDISNKLSPTQLARIDVHSRVTSLQLHNDLLYATTRRHDVNYLKIVDIRDVHNPIILNSIAVPKNGKCAVLPDGKIVLTYSNGAMVHNPFVCYADQ